MPTNDNHDDEQQPCAAGGGRGDLCCQLGLIGGRADLGLIAAELAWSREDSDPGDYSWGRAAAQASTMMLARSAARPHE
ncbi:hypothetical protein MAHJHV47_46330 [Mycobacterium avium subsp. hominissuis]